MNILVPVLALFLAFGSPPQRADLKLEVGSVLPARYAPRHNRNLYMTNSSQFRPFVKRKVGGVVYYIAYEEESRVIKYLSTTDRNFETADGLRVGGYVEVDNEQLMVYPGWEVRGPEGKDGWLPLVGFDSEMTLLEGGGEAKVKLKQYRLDPDRTIRAKIIGFVKGGN